MTKDKDPLLVVDASRQQTFGFVQDDGYSLELVGETVEGYGLYRRKEGHGGYSYWSDEVAPSVLVYDEGVSNPLTLFAALNDLEVGELMWRHIGAVYDYTLP
jgi:hypothetical protein